MNFSTNSTDNSLSSIQSNINSGGVNVQNKQYRPGGPLTITELSTADEIAFPVIMVRNNISLQNTLNQAINNGKRVYLFGDGLTLVEYKNLLHLDSLDVYTNNGMVDLAKDPTPEKGTIKENPERETITGEDYYSVIGYTKNTGVPLQLITNTMTNGYEDEYFGTVPSNLQMNQYYQEILDNVTQNKILSDQFGPYGIVNSSKVKYQLTAYLGVQVGKVVSQWILNKNTSETDKNFDFFYVTDLTQLLTYNSGRATYLKTDHDIPYSTDYIQTWGPHDDSDGHYTVQLTVPWSASFSFDMVSKPSIDDISNSDLDYARWVVRDTDMSDDTFEPKTQWKSAGTYASMDIRHWATFSGILDGRTVTTQVSHKLDVDYDY